jgi:hypothetical protein
MEGSRETQGSVASRDAMADVVDCMGKELVRHGGRNQKQKQNKKLDGTKPKKDDMCNRGEARCMACVLGAKQSSEHSILHFLRQSTQGFS